ncbi:hypothetical protein MGG_01455 [Pyricularia oryzae 70-15]|uniref:Uncharacterized protein n=3 Tax=Pyricularia oryzae TaxID=318829 RepID=G4MSI5_PYRO7|nr:uncharacterized protein MGG_01455 [Pyricularia oryzae 70-15]EHA54601.1 hypothetical protein MGG_01455 [Pyricularia oryzae 70-15]ELQ37565.1 hypothetical protein OOU_Y34scaffold00590g79 [Pyricularia oryzae Y34]KAI7931730.1 hypothetical protein M9X92_000048 [Pyricularia oryzae]KAI7932832.1 hypothetical protein M0657_000141 [Pyricularia oryzae]
MLGKSFVFGSLVAFSLLNNVAATTTEELFVMGLGTTIPPNARKGNVGLGDYGGLNPNAVSHLPEKDTKVKLSDQPNRLVSYYKKKDPDATYYVYGIDKNEEALKFALWDMMNGKALNALPAHGGNEVPQEQLDYSAKYVVKKAPIPWHMIKGWWIAAPGHDSTEFHPNPGYSKVPSASLMRKLKFWRA